MLFNSLTYWVFLPIITLLYFIVKHKYRWVILLIASYIFYMTWRMEYALLILFSTAVDYWVGIQMEKRSKEERKPFLILSLVANLGLLIFYKYLNFLNEVLQDVFGWVNVDYNIPELNILLPVGISFYTFQTLSYTIDIYRGDRKAEKHFGIFALYVSFFPQLVAGPIERSTTFLPQLYEKHLLKLQPIVDGGKLIVWGLFKKMIIGDHLAIFVNNVYGQPEEYSGNMLVLATYAFTVQVYCDFSGYTDIAIGSAKVFGFSLSNNFDRPLFASSISKLWRKWHMSLTQWIRDYFYTPLMNRVKTEFGSYLILYLVLIVIGIWHGVGWQYVFFGIIHGLYLTIQRLSVNHRNRLSMTLRLERIPKFKKMMDVFITFHLWAFSMICFRSSSAEESFYIMKNIFSGGGITTYFVGMKGFYLSNIIIIISSTVLFFSIEYLNKNDLRNPFIVLKNKGVRWGTYIIIVFYLMVFRVNDSMEFFYFQF